MCRDEAGAIDLPWIARAPGALLHHHRQPGWTLRAVPQRWDARPADALRCDAFFTWVRWRHHPYSALDGGPCASREELVICPATRQEGKARLAFATERWGGAAPVIASSPVRR